MGAIGSDRHARSVVGAAAGAAHVLHGDDVPAGLKHLAPPRRTASGVLKTVRPLRRTRSRDLLPG